MGAFLHELRVLGKRSKVHFRHHVVARGREASFWVALSFLLTFGTVRFITIRIRKQHMAAQKHPGASPKHHSRWGLHDIILPGGLHLHHAVPGIFLALTSGYLALISEKQGARNLSIMYGTGAALALDEFALWLELRDVYWAKEGRLSFDAVAAAGALFMGGYALSEFGGAILRDLHIRATTGAYPPHHAELNSSPSPDGKRAASGEALPAGRA